MYEYKAEILKVYDGDGAFDAVVDLGMGIKYKRKIRLFGVDTPEMRGEQKQAGKVVRDFVRDLILGKDVVIQTHYDKSGKYGRLLANITTEEGDLAEILISKGYAKEYDGGTKEPWEDTELHSITIRG
jgi:micrococcal nuclease